MADKKKPSFDPDKFLAETSTFDPDKFLAETATPSNEPNFAPGPVVQLHADIPAAQRVMGGVESFTSAIPGAMQAGSAIEAGMDQAKDLFNGGQKTFSEHYADAKDKRRGQLADIRAMDPATFHTARTAETAAAQIALKHPALIGAHSTAQTLYDLGSEEDPNTVNGRAITNGLYDGLLAYGFGKIGGQIGKSMAKEAEAVGPGTPVLKKIMRSFGKAPSKIEQDIIAIEKGVASPANNETEAVRTLAEKGLFRGNPDPVKITRDLDTLITNNSAQMAADAKAAAQAGRVAKFNPEAAMEDVVHELGDEAGVAAFDDAVKNYGKDLYGEMSPEKMLKLRQTLGSRVYKSGGSVDPKVIAGRVIYKHLNNALDEAIASPTFRQMNKETSAAIHFKDFGLNAFDKGMVGGSMASRGVKGFTEKSGSFSDRLVQSGKSALRGNIDVNMAPPPPTPQMTPLGPDLSQLPMTAKGNPGLILFLGQHMRDLVSAKKILVIEAAKQLNALHADGTIPQALRQPQELPATIDFPASIATPQPDDEPILAPLDTFKKAR